MKPAAFLSAVMGVAAASVPVVLTYLVKVKELHKPKAERKAKTRKDSLS